MKSKGKGNGEAKVVATSACTWLSQQFNSRVGQNSNSSNALFVTPHERAAAGIRASFLSTAPDLDADRTSELELEASISRDHDHKRTLSQ